MIRKWAVVVLAGLLASPAAALALTIYTDEASFTADHAIASTETFDGLAAGWTGTSVLTLDEVTYTLTGGADVGEWIIAQPSIAPSPQVPMSGRNLGGELGAMKANR